ncbi:photosystem II reaction center W protein, chloroplastic-like isoform X1 [Arachis stenosperma]|uniref:photosystem II reaction center W protein, chloroplastic-like isoform X1 n=1 Tax=Arachis stenosperma TaxID=217475 RepID=UPI0025AD91F9|nr:photosystem II reaction center W protein, chloroplastic-like isoform X1 [Arachis stenosperma]
MEATISTTSTASSITRTSFVQNRPLGNSSSSILALPTVSKLGGRIRCSMEGKPSIEEESKSKMGMGASSSILGVAIATTMSSPAAIALVDERMSTEGTGLPFGLSNNILGWILFGVFALIWSLYFVYTSTLDEDEDSGLSL